MNELVSAIEEALHLVTDPQSSSDRPYARDTMTRAEVDQFISHGATAYCLAVPLGYDRCFPQIPSQEPAIIDPSLPPQFRHPPQYISRFNLPGDWDNVVHQNEHVRIDILGYSAEEEEHDGTISEDRRERMLEAWHEQQIRDDLLPLAMSNLLSNGDRVYLAFDGGDSG